MVADCTHLSSRRKRCDEHIEKLACSDPYAAESWMVHGALDMAEHLAKMLQPFYPDMHLTSDSYYMHYLCPMYQRINEMAVALLFEAPG